VDWRLLFFFFFPLGKWEGRSGDKWSPLFPSPYSEGNLRVPFFGESVEWKISLPLLLVADERDYSLFPSLR